MSQANFAYDTPSAEMGAARMGGAAALAVSIFADRADLRVLLAEDAEAAGFRIAQAGGLGLLLADEAGALGDVVMVDCPAVDGASLAALARLDMRVAQAGAQLVVSTSVAALDDVFACLDQSFPQILVDPGRAERVVALGRVLGRASPSGVRELSDGDRVTLLRLTEQVSQIADRLDRLSGTPTMPGESPTRLEAPRPGFAGAVDEGSDRLVRQDLGSLPDPRLVRRIIRQRQLRARFFDGDLFADPAWDILLDLTAARAEQGRVSVSSLCIASGVPPTTALRWIGQMTEVGLLRRVEDQSDRRRAFIALSENAAEAMGHYFAELGEHAHKLI